MPGAALGAPAAQGRAGGAGTAARALLPAERARQEKGALSSLPSIQAASAAVSPVGAGFPFVVPPPSRCALLSASSRDGVARFYRFPLHRPGWRGGAGASLPQETHVPLRLTGWLTAPAGLRGCRCLPAPRGFPSPAAASSRCPAPRKPPPGGAEPSRAVAGRSVPGWCRRAGECPRAGPLPSLARLPQLAAGVLGSRRPVALPAVPSLRGGGGGSAGSGGASAVAGHRPAAAGASSALSSSSRRRNCLYLLLPERAGA